MIKNRLPACLLLLLFPFFLRSQSTSNDCANAQLLCNKNLVTVPFFNGAGSNTSEVGTPSCLEFPFPESHSSWFKWTIETSGSLGFTILPINEQDDIDFVLYRLQGDLSQYDLREELRCLAYGPEMGESKSVGQNCTGATGLVAGAAPNAFGEGCPVGVENFLELVSVESGESYILFINNFRSSNGFLLEFSGTCTFKEIAGPCNTSTSTVLNNLQDAVLDVSEVVPNPATDAAQINLTATRALAGQLLLIDLNGRIRKSSPLNIMPGENILSLDVSVLEPGVFFVKIRLEGHTYLARFYKH